MQPTGGVDAVSAADEVDPEYGAELRRVARAGVEVRACGGDVDVDAIRIARSLPVVL